VLLAGSATAVDPVAHVPVLLADVTALPEVEGTHNDTELACATAPPDKPAVIAITGRIRRLTVSRRMTPPFIKK
jgi:hypothetical protein